MVRWSMVSQDLVAKAVPPRQQPLDDPIGKISFFDLYINVILSQPLHFTETIVDIFVSINRAGHYEPLNSAGPQ